jgi:hypothetical protein
MADAWDEDNLEYNLSVLGDLRKAPGKPKLRYVDGRFSIDSRWGISRGRSDDSVTSEKNFAIPLRGLLRQSKVLVRQGVLKPDRFDDAVDGLIRLRRTYDGNPAKVAHLDKILKDLVAEGFTRGLNENSESMKKLVDFRTKHVRYMLYSFRQRDYLKKDQPDVCEGLVVQWARRILFGAKSYSISKNEVERYTKKERMQKQVTHASRLQEAMARLPSGGRNPSAFRGNPRFGGIGYHDNYHEHPDGTINATCWQEILTSARTGREFFTEPEKVVIVKLDKTGSLEKGHALGLRVYGEGFRHTQFFDPNVGEFHFPSGTEQQFFDFGEDLLSELYSDGGRLPWSKTPKFDRWGMMPFRPTHRPPRESSSYRR